MTKQNVAVVVLAAGMGTRMKSALPKALHPLAHRPMIGWLLEAAGSLAPERTVIVVGPDMDAVAKAVAPHPTAVQAERLGTGHAVAQAKAALAGFNGIVLVLYADTPLIGPDTLRALVDRFDAPSRPGIVVLGFQPDDPGEYGRLVLAPDGGLEAIVESKDSTPAQRAIGLCNSGVMAVESGLLFDLIDKLGCDNAKGEYYLTDLVALARKEGRNCAHVEGAPDELIGINSRRELAVAEALVQNRMRLAALEAGVSMSAPETVHLCWDTQLAADVSIEPFVVFGPGVVVEAGASIRSFSHIEAARIGSGAIVGPFARLRPGAKLGAGSHVGNFVELKNAELGPGAKANHLSYIGDAYVGAKANIGAGTITCNYDGVNKHKTNIGAGAFIGSNSALVAPVTIGDGALVGAGSVITEDVPAGAMALGRGRQANFPDRAKSKPSKAKAGS